MIGWIAVGIGVVLLASAMQSDGVVVLDDGAIDRPVVVATYPAVGRVALLAPRSGAGWTPEAWRAYVAREIAAMTPARRAELGAVMTRAGPWRAVDLGRLGVAWRLPRGASRVELRRRIQSWLEAAP